MEKNKIRLSVNDFKTPTKTYQDNKTLAKQQKRKEISPNDQLNLDKKLRPFSQTVQNPPVNMSVNKSLKFVCLIFALFFVVGTSLMGSFPF